MCEKPVFRAYYEIAQAAIAMRYMNGVINPSIAQRFMRLYFPELKKDEDDLITHKAKAAKKTEEESHDDLVRKLAQALQDSETVPGTEEAG